MIPSAINQEAAKRDHAPIPEFVFQVYNSIHWILIIPLFATIFSKEIKFWPMLSFDI